MKKTGRKETVILKGNLCYSESLQQIRTVPQGFLVCEEGICRGVHFLGGDTGNVETYPCAGRRGSPDHSWNG